MHICPEQAQTQDAGSIPLFTANSPPPPPPHSTPQPPLSPPPLPPPPSKCLVCGSMQRLCIATYNAEWLMYVCVCVCVRVQLVLSSVHAVKGLECVVCFVVGMDTKAWRYLPCPVSEADVQQVCPMHICPGAPMDVIWHQHSRSQLCLSTRVHADLLGRSVPRLFTQRLSVVMFQHYSNNPPPTVPPSPPPPRAWNPPGRLAHDCCFDLPADS